MLTVLVALGLLAAAADARTLTPGSSGLAPGEYASLTKAGFLPNPEESVPANEVADDGEQGAHRSFQRSPAPAAFGTRTLQQPTAAVEIAALFLDKNPNICDLHTDPKCKEGAESGHSSSHAPPVNLTGNSELKVVCYFTTWSWKRLGLGHYHPKDIDANLCTHIVYYTDCLDASTLTIAPCGDTLAGVANKFYEKMAAYRAKGVKVSLAIGGWKESGRTGHGKYSKLVNNPDARKHFVKTTLEFIERYGFDGLDLGWHYPKCWQDDCDLGPDSDKEGFAALVAELRAAFRPEGRLLSATVAPRKPTIDAGYDVPALSRDLDWISVMAYDLNGHGFQETGHVAPLYYAPGDDFDYLNVNFTMHYWIAKGADKKKLVMGLPMYGRSFTLADNNERGLNSMTYGPGEEGVFTLEGGFLAYYEICDSVKRHGWTAVRDPEGRIGTYAYRGNQWVGYDDVEDVRRKSKFIKELGLAGGMVWTLDLDDFRNRCGCGQYPLLKTINHELRGLPYSTMNCT